MSQNGQRTARRGFRSGASPSSPPPSYPAVFWHPPSIYQLFLAICGFAANTTLPGRLFWPVRPPGPFVMACSSTVTSAPQVRYFYIFSFLTSEYVSLLLYLCYAPVRPDLTGYASNPP